MVLPGRCGIFAMGREACTCSAMKSLSVSMFLPKRPAVRSKVPSNSYASWACCAYRAPQYVGQKARHYRDGRRELERHLRHLRYSPCMRALDQSLHALACCAKYYADAYARTDRDYRNRHV